MLVYVDASCFNRPFDDQEQRRVAEETRAVFRILERIVDDRLDLAWSEVLDLENSRHPLVDRRTEIGRWRQKAAVHVAVTIRSLRLPRLSTWLACRRSMPLTSPAPRSAVAKPC